ncbi:hypothetical protein AbraIFM66951_011920 [Aspergillus brasiliensis]|uniref:Rhodopsin domain-containing protein n=1 Tax=Aspergillus brasiliensis TaxID=319629 RepID=A0A9W6DPB6_9EURO|nr:hypothetical protein AbraCBS73388_011640 [Aspergillus brasiliensis]GKZ48162.1 hypothetical protein AbraIFM66951_011920 [Aspergillus brasiliensis]
MTPADRRQGIKLIATTTVFLVLSSTAVLLRAIAIRIRKTTWKNHDYLTALALVSLACYAVTPLVGVMAGGYGWNITTVPMDKLVVSLKALFACEWFFVVAQAAFRLAILCLYLEIFRGIVFRWCTIITMVIVTLYCIASMLTIALICRPINANWNVMIKKTCGDMAKTEYASAGFNFTVDLLIVSLPMPIVWTLQMPKEKKVSVTGAFLLGLVTAGVNIERIIQFKTCDQANNTYCILDASVLIMAEITCGILVSCAPTLGPIFFRARAHTYKPAASVRRGLRTFGSSERSWPRRKPQIDTLLHSMDDDFNQSMGGARVETHQMTNIICPGASHHTNPGEIRVQSQLSVWESVTPEQRV